MNKIVDCIIKSNDENNNRTYKTFDNIKFIRVPCSSENFFLSEYKFKGNFDEEGRRIFE